jgi:DNA-binding response OmpR family regulator
MRILIVDDELMNRRLLRVILEKVQGYEIFEADDGHKALEIAGKIPIDLVLLDIMMPGIDGYETCRRLKELPGFILVIIISAVSDLDATRARVLDCGADDLLSKPIDRHALLMRLSCYDRLKKHYRTLEHIQQSLSDAGSVTQEIDELHVLLKELREILANQDTRSCEERMVHTLGQVELALEELNAFLVEYRIQVDRAPLD